MTSATPKPRAGEHTSTARQAVLDAAQYPGSGLSLVPGPLAMDHADELDALRERERELVEVLDETMSVALRAPSCMEPDCSICKVNRAIMTKARAALAKSRP